MTKSAKKPAGLRLDLALLAICISMAATGHWGGLERLIDARQPEIFDAYCDGVELNVVIFIVMLGCAGAVSVRQIFKRRTAVAWSGFVRCAIILVISAGVVEAWSWGPTWRTKFMARLEAKAREKGVIPAIRAWARSLEIPEGDRERGRSEVPDLQDRQWPECVKAFHVRLVTAIREGRAVDLGWSGPIGRYGLVVGQEDMPTPGPKENETIIPLEPGAYLYAMP